MALKPQPLCCRGCGETVPAPAVGEYEVVCECGAVSNAVYNSEEEYRIFEPEDEGKRHYVSYTREDSAEVPVPATDEKTRKWAETRVNQVKMLLSHLDSDQPGRKYLSVDEVRRAVRDLRAATHEYARCPDEGAEKASPVFWAIAAAQNVAARRRAEWTTDTESMAEAWSMDSLHAYLSQFQSESQVTAERLGNATRVGGSSGMSHAARLVDDQTRRRLSIYALGDSTARRVKLCTLDSLLKKAGRPGLAEPVLAQKLPRVVAPLKPVGRAGAVLERLAAQPKWVQQYQVARKTTAWAVGRKASLLTCLLALPTALTRILGSKSGCGTPEFELSPIALLTRRVLAASLARPPRFRRHSPRNQPPRNRLPARALRTR